MKRLLLTIAILALFVPAVRQADAAEVSIDFFYNNLGDSGNWVEVADYGYVWQPSVAVSNANWRPYADGYWAYTDVGWTWVSYEDFGWATYHYGRWARLRDRGWFWVPGQEWGPAWVSWRTGGDYVGWAPLPPRGGAEVVYEGRPVYGAVDVDYDIGPLYYNFVDVRYIGEPVLRERIFEPTQNVTYIQRTVNVTNITYNNNTVYNYGPDYNTLSAYSARPIQRLTLQRETTADVGAAAQTGALTKVQGDKLVVAAPARLAKAAPGVAPKAIKEKITKPTIEHGWSGIADQKTVAQLKQKMKAEDPKKVPPPDITPRPGASVAPAQHAAPATAASPATPAIPPGGSASPGTGAKPATPASPAPAASAAAGKGKGKEKRGEHAPPFASPAPSAGASAAPGASPALTPVKGKGKGKNAEHAPAPATSPGSAAPRESVAPAAPATPAKGKGKGRNARPESAPRTSAAPQNGTGVREPAAPVSRAQPERAKENKGHKAQNLNTNPAGSAQPNAGPANHQPSNVSAEAARGKQRGGANREAHEPAGGAAPQQVPRGKVSAPPQGQAQHAQQPSASRAAPPAGANASAGGGEQSPAKGQKEKKGGKPVPSATPPP
jgi:hypothetical protein